MENHASETGWQKLFLIQMLLTFGGRCNRNQEGEIDLSDKRCVWDWIKYNIRLHAISYSKEKAKLKYEKEQRIQQELRDANRLFENDPSASNRLRLDEIKEKLELFYEEKVKGIVIRARAR